MSEKLGSVSSGDVCKLVATSGAQKQVIYPVSNAGYWKMGWIKVDNAPAPVPSDFPVPALGYNYSATTRTTVYESVETMGTYYGQIFVDDLCTINGVSISGNWVYVSYPASGTTKNGYVYLDQFFPSLGNISKPYTTKVSARSTSYRKADMATSYGYAEAGDTITVVGRDGNKYQVIYPITVGANAGKYKLAWIYGDNIVKNLVSIAVTQKPSKTVYLEGENFSTSGMVVTAYYDDGSSAAVTGYSYSGYTSTPGAKTITVSYGGKTTAIDVTVKAKSPTALTITTNPSKMTYFVGQDFSSAGMVVKATYNNGTSSNVSDYYASYDFSSAGSKTVTISYTYNGTTVKTTLTVTVQTPTVSSIAVATKPNKTSYFVGDKLDITGLTLTASYNDGSQKTISSGFSCSPVDLNTAGTQTITISYGGKTTTFTVTVNAVTLTKIEVASKPSKTSYYVGEKLNTAGLTLKATYNNGSTQTISSGFSCSPMDLNTAGTQTITVSYSGKTTTFTVTVNAVTLTKIEVASKPSKTSYYVGEKLDTAGLTLKATYNSGSTQTISSGFSCSPMDLNTAGTQSITVSYGGKTTSFDVIVYDVHVESISIATKPTKTTYYVGDTLDTTGLTLTATYSNGTTRKISSGFTCTPTTLNTAGTQTITVSYEGRTTAFALEVLDIPVGRVSVSKVSGAPGETVQVAVNLDNNPGIMTARLFIGYDSGVLTLTEAKVSSILGDSVFCDALSSNPYNLFWEYDQSESVYTATGTIIWMTFKIAENAPAGEFPITVSYDPDEVYNEDVVRVALTVSQGSVTVKKNDPDAPQIIAENKTASCGTTVTLDVQIANNPGFSVLNVAFLYDTEYLTLRGIENHLSAMTMTQGASVVWDAAENYTGDGVLCTLTFEIAENAPEGAYEIQTLFISASNSDFEEVTMDGVSGILEVRDILYGDVNGDGKIASVDLAMLRKHIASVDPITGVSTVAVKAGADCNGDGKINSVDLAMLRRYLASVDPITGESPIILGPK